MLARTAETSKRWLVLGLSLHVLAAALVTNNILCSSSGRPALAEARAGVSQTADAALTGARDARRIDADGVAPAALPARSSPTRGE